MSPSTKLRLAPSPCFAASGVSLFFQVLAAQEGRARLWLSTTIAHATNAFMFLEFLATTILLPCFPIDLISSVKLASRDCYNHPPDRWKKRYLLKWLKKAGRQQCGFIQEKYCRELYRSIVPPAPVCRCVWMKPGFNITLHQSRCSSKRMSIISGPFFFNNTQPLPVFINPELVTGFITPLAPITNTSLPCHVCSDETERLYPASFTRFYIVPFAVKHTAKQ